MDGDGTGPGRKYKYLGWTNSRDHCLALVLQKHKGANGVTYSGSSTGKNYCYANFGVTGATGEKYDWQTCIFRQGNISCSSVLCCLHNINSKIILCI